MNRAAFTLIEVLVAVAIAAVVGIVVITMFTSTSRHVNQQVYEANQTAIIQRALGLIGDDIRRAEKIVTPTGVASALPVADGITPTLPTAAGAERLDIYLVRIPEVVGCPYEFRSYMLANRSELVALSGSDWLDLPADPSNDTSGKVLLQYNACVGLLSDLPVVGELRLVTDHVKSLAFEYPSANEVKVQLQGQRVVQSRTILSPRTPAAATYYSRRF